MIRIAPSVSAQRFHPVTSPERAHPSADFGIAPTSNTYPGYLMENLLYDLDYDTDVTASTEDADYPLENLSDKKAGVVFKWTTATSGWIEFDLGSIKNINLCGLINHSFVGAEVVTVSAGETSAFSQIMSFTYRKNDMYAYLQMPFPARYVRIAWTGASAAHSIGELVLGSIIALTSKCRINVLNSMEEIKISRHTGRGVHSAYDMFSITTHACDFEVLTTSQKTEFKTMHQSSDGDRYPFLWIPDLDKTELLYGFKQQDFSSQTMSVHRWRFQLIMNSASRGE